MMTVEKIAKVVSEINRGLKLQTTGNRRPKPTQIQLLCLCVYRSVCINTLFNANGDTL